jgi:hypothetical protein
MKGNYMDKAFYRKLLAAVKAEHPRGRVQLVIYCGDSDSIKDIVECGISGLVRSRNRLTAFASGIFDEATKNRNSLEVLLIDVGRLYKFQPVPKMVRGVPLLSKALPHLKKLDESINVK